MANEYDKKLLDVISKLINLLIFLLVLVIVLGILLYNYMPEYVPAPDIERETSTVSSAPLDEKKDVDTVKYWQAPDVATLDSDANKDLILYGKDLIAHTADYYGPNGKIFKSTINGMNCQNCHLDAGTKVFGNNYSAVASTYPKFRARSGSIENIYKRVNDCFERSLNGKAIDTASKEMQGIVAYIKWLGKDVPKGNVPEGSGLKKMAFLDRAASPENGKSIYSQKCASCHQTDGLGIMNGDKTAYTYPPLWGDHSYNNGAGLFRMSNLAKYIKYNMPLGASHNSPQLTDEEAWDIAAFVNSQPRPKKNIKKDWPKIEEKPFDHPFGPYKDGFSEEQHKYGPFQPIKDKIASSKKK
ncbi:MAG: c-type cytochrome [Bacteroidia bacterium]|nr:c-type cytochrome [Bacteroidia bacterium]